MNDNENQILMRLNEACSNKNFNNIFTLCKNCSLPYFGMFLSTVLMRQRVGQQHIQDDLPQYYEYFSEAVLQQTGNKDDFLEKDEELKVQLLCNWTSTEKLTSLWSKMSKYGNGVWGRIRLVTDEIPDFWVIINRPLPDSMFIPEKSIVFQMEPNMKTSSVWGEWSNPDPRKFLYVFTHEGHNYNNIEWHLDLTWEQLKNMKIEKLHSTNVSTILSNKYWDEGHIKRVDFIKYLEQKIDVDVYGNNIFCYKNFKGELPYHNKNNALLPYKYTFNAENNEIDNYFTEKIIDGILAECLVFYWGCPNLNLYIDERAYIRLPLEDLQKSYEIVKNSIEQDEWGKRIDIIRQEKQKILDELQFFPRLHRLLV